jgi:hypothetical protein
LRSFGLGNSRKFWRRKETEVFHEIHKQSDVRLNHQPSTCLNIWWTAPVGWGLDMKQGRIKKALGFSSSTFHFLLGLMKALFGTL